MTQKVGKSIVGFFGTPREKEGKIGWRSSKKEGQVDLGFLYLGFWNLGFSLRLLVRYFNL
jgi:hypothetical protein